MGSESIPGGFGEGVPAAGSADALAPRSAPAGSPTDEPTGTGFVRRVAGGTFLYGLGASVPQFVRFLLLPVFTRVLSVADYGIIELAGSFGTFLQTPMRMGVTSAVTRSITTTRKGAGCVTTSPAFPGSSRSQV